MSWRVGSITEKEIPPGVPIFKIKQLEELLNYFPQMEKRIENILKKENTKRR